jgi:hypothetical protein
MLHEFILHEQNFQQHQLSLSFQQSHYKFLNAKVGESGENCVSLLEGLSHSHSKGWLWTVVSLFPKILRTFTSKGTTIASEHSHEDSGVESKVCAVFPTSAAFNTQVDQSCHEGASAQAPSIIQLHKKRLVF